MKLVKFVTILQLLCWNVEAYWPNNQTIIKIINSMNTTWKAGKNPTNIPRRYPKEERRPPGLPMIKTKNLRSPEKFDARLHFSGCGEVIGRIRNQYKCGSCWAVSTTAMLSHRICIETKGAIRVHLSAEDVITCCHSCRTSQRIKRSCRGAPPYSAISFWIKEGIVTGGELGSNEGCKPYSSGSSVGQHQECQKLCTGSYYRKKYSEDKHFGKLAYTVPRKEQAIKAEIFRHGSVRASFALHDDFRQYRSGVYQFRVGQFNGRHGIVLIGWGVENNVKYWLAANTWGTGFGSDRGYVKFLRGQNHCGVESKIIAGRMSSTVSVREKLVSDVGGHSSDDPIQVSTVCVTTMIHFSLYLHFR